MENRITALILDDAKRLAATGQVEAIDGMTGLTDKLKEREEVIDLRSEYWQKWNLWLMLPSGDPRCVKLESELDRLRAEVAPYCLCGRLVEEPGRTGEWCSSCYNFTDPHEGPELRI